MREQGFVILRCVDTSRKLPTVTVFFANLPLVLASASLEIGKGVRSMSNGPTCWAKLYKTRVRPSGKALPGATG